MIASSFSYLQRQEQSHTYNSLAKVVANKALPTISNQVHTCPFHCTLGSPATISKYNVHQCLTFGYCLQVFCEKGRKTHQQHDYLGPRTCECTTQDSNPELLVDKQLTQPFFNIWLQCSSTYLTPSFLKETVLSSLGSV